MASDFKFTINFNNSKAEHEDLEKDVQNLKRQMIDLMKDLDEDEEPQLVDDPNPPEGSKGFGVLLGLLTAEVSAANAKNVLNFLGDRLSNKTIELEVEGNGRSLKVSASSRAEIEAAIQQAQAFIAAPA